MATLAADNPTKMEKEAIDRVQTRWEKPFQRKKERTNLFFFVTKRRVEESDPFDHVRVRGAFHCGTGGVGDSGADASAETEVKGEHVADSGGSGAAAGPGIQEHANVAGKGVAIH